MRAALKTVHDAGTYNFHYAALVGQQYYGVPIQPAYNRLDVDYNFAGFPTSFLDGGYGVLVGNYGATTYQSWITNLSQRPVPPLEIMTAIEWLGNATVRTYVRIANGTSVNSVPTDLQDPVIPAEYLVGTEIDLQTYATDADDDSLYYQWDIQGVQTTRLTTDWLGPFAQGEMATYPYQFDATGDYTVSVRAKEVWGNMTDWSTPQPISISCCQVRADINNSGAGPDITDLVYLVTYMFSQGPEPPCLEAANINGLGADAPDIADLVYLVTFMFSGGPDPVPCALQN